MAWGSHVVTVGGGGLFTREAGEYAYLPGLGVEHRGLLRVVQPGLQFGEFLDGAGAAGLEFVTLPDQPLVFLGRRAGLGL